MLMQIINNSQNQNPRPYLQSPNSTSTERLEADKAYRDMKAFKQSQSIIINGESGAGK